MYTVPDEPPVVKPKGLVYTQPDADPHQATKAPSSLIYDSSNDEKTNQRKKSSKVQLYALPEEANDGPVERVDLSELRKVVINTRRVTEEEIIDQTDA